MLLTCHILLHLVSCLPWTWHVMDKKNVESTAICSCVAKLKPLNWTFTSVAFAQLIFGARCWEINEEMTGSSWNFIAMFGMCFVFCTFVFWLCMHGSKSRFRKLRRATTSTRWLHHGDAPLSRHDGGALSMCGGNFAGMLLFVCFARFAFSWGFYAEQDSEAGAKHTQCWICAWAACFFLCRFWLQAGPKGASSKAVTPPGKRDNDDNEDDAEEVTVKVVKLMKSETKVAPTVKPIEKKKMPAGGSAFSPV